MGLRNSLISHPTLLMTSSEIQPRLQTERPEKRLTLCAAPSSAAYIFAFSLALSMELNMFVTNKATILKKCFHF